MNATDSDSRASILHTGPELRDAVFFDGADSRTKYSRFWTLLVLAAIIASAGVIGDSEATVIGAMIVAPLRIPILGTVLAIVLGDRRNLVRSAGLVLSGGACAVAVGYLMASLALDGRCRRGARARCRRGARRRPRHAESDTERLISGRAPGCWQFVNARY
jgi:Domain of unknown function (DUF389)